MAKRKYVKENNLVKAINTDSLELQKPLVNEYYDINVHNSNMDKIDAGYKQNKNDISNINYELSKVENTKYATKNGIKEFNCKDGYIDNVTIEGETLVNLVRNDLKIHIWYGDRCVIDLVNCGYLKGTYTIFNFSNKKIYQDIGVAGDAGTWLKGITIEPCQSIAFDIVEGEQLSYVSCAFIDGWENTDTSITEFRESIVLLEGDHTDKPISYFEGLASVGQGDKIEVVSCINNIYSDINKTVGKILNGEGVLVDYPTHDCSDYIVIEPNSIYYTNIPHRFVVYDANKNIIDNKAVVGMSSVNGKYIMPNNAKYLRINLDKDTSNYLITKKYDKKQISTTLRSLPNGVKDTIEKRGNKYVKVQRCGEITLSGNESWNLWGLPSQNICKFYITVSGTKPSLLYTDVPNIYCSHFKQRPQSDMHEGTSNVEGVAVGHSHFQEVIVCIDKNKLSTQDIEGFKTWLRANPITVVYELETPIVTELPNFNPQTYSDSTTLLLNSGVVQGECSFEVTNSMGSEIEVLKDKVSGLDDYVKTEEVYYPTLLNGFEVAYPDVDINYIRKAGNMCFMYLSIKNISDVERGTVILRLPTHLRPKNLKRVLGMIDYLNHSIIVYGDGRITLSKQGSVNIANKELRVECWWEVE